MDKRVMRLLVLLGLVVLVMGGKTVNELTCSEAVAQLLPCKGFLEGPDTSPLPTCCSAVDNLNKEANTKEIRQQLCECFKKVAPTIGVKPDKARILPFLCKVSVPVPIDPNIDCSKIN